MPSKEKIVIQDVETPVGKMQLGAYGDKLCLCSWKLTKRLVEFGIISDDTSSSQIILEARQELDEYFAGKRKAFDIPLEMIGTDFQKSVWQALLTIPFGKTVSYLDIAQRVGDPRGVRAVAQAIGANPLAIFVPCHRVIGSNGSLTGFAGGLDAKRYLLEIEKN